MKCYLKGASEKRRLTHNVTNTVLDDNFKSTTEQFVLHFNDQFRQLDEISEASELFSPTVKLILLQNTVRGISDLRIVETLDEFQSTTQGHGKYTNIKYETCYDLLINACVRYDQTHKANLGKRSIIYTTFTQKVEKTLGDDQFSSENQWKSSFQGIDIATNEFYNVNSTTSHLPMSSRHQKTPQLHLKSLHDPMLNPIKNLRKENGMDLFISLNLLLYNE